MRLSSGYGDRVEEIGDVLLHQEVIAGVGNVFKSEICFVTSTSPFCKVAVLAPQKIDELISVSRKLVKAMSLKTQVTRPSPSAVGTGALPVKSIRERAFGCMGVRAIHAVAAAN